MLTNERHLGNRKEKNDTITSKRRNNYKNSRLDSVQENGDKIRKAQDKKLIERTSQSRTNDTLLEKRVEMRTTHSRKSGERASNEKNKFE